MNLEVTFHSANPDSYRASASNQTVFGALPPVATTPAQDVLTSTGTVDQTAAVDSAVIARVMADGNCRVHWGASATATASVGMKLVADQEAFLLLASGDRVSMISV